jgi:hypothetical protein
MNLFGGLTGTPRSTPQAVWRNRWPQHCRSCRGWGGSAYTEMHGFRGGSGEQMFDLCGARDENQCHRCVDMGLKDGDGPCRTCGWNYNDGEPEIYDDTPMD